MPTFEIVSVESQVGPHTPRVRSFVQRCDSRLVSDRGLFQSVLDRLRGTMIHLGHYSRKHDSSFWFCGHALKVARVTHDGFFTLRAAALKDLRVLLRTMQRASPSRHVVFLSDYQFGPRKPVVRRVSSIEEFAKLGSSGRLRFNTLYHIKRSPPKTPNPEQRSVAP